MTYLKKLKIQKPDLSKRGLSYSSAKEFYKSPIDYMMYLNKEYEQTDAMILGSCLDCLLLTPDNFENDFIIIDKIDRRSKAGKEYFAQQQTLAKEQKKTLLPRLIYATAILMKQSLEANDQVMALLNNCTETQKRLEWNYKGIRNVGYLDGVGEIFGNKFIFDLKTTQDASPQAWSKTITKWNYDLQLAMYRIGWERNYFEFPELWHIVIESKPPYKCNTFKIGDSVLEIGTTIYDRIIKNFKYCMEHDLWNSGYEFWQDPVETIELPTWYINQHSNIINQ